LQSFVARFLALAVKPFVATFMQVHTSLEEAARSSGATLSRSLLIPEAAEGLVGRVAFRTYRGDALRCMCVPATTTFPCSPV